MARPWSKYAAGSSRFQQQQKEHDSAAAGADKDQEARPQDGKASKSKGAGKDDAALASNPEFKEFMETMQARSKSRFWANDDTQGPEEQAAKAKARDQGDESDDEYQELEPDAANKAASKNEAVSDMDFLRSKVSKSLDRESEEEDGDDGGDSEKEYAEDIEVDDDDDDKDGNSAKKTPGKGGDGRSSGQGEAFTGESEPTKRLFVRNLPFTTVEEDLMELFEKFGQVAEVHMPLDDTKRRKGFGFVSFKTTVDAQAALTALNGFAFQGRLLHVMFAKEKPEKVDPEAALADPNLTYKQRKELERQLQASKQTGWNASYIRGDATVGSLAERMGVKRGEIMDKENGNMAVRLAIGETMLVKENKDFFAREGVDLNAIEGALVKKSGESGVVAKSKKIERSSTVILIKNLPHTTEEEELAQLFRKHGEIGRFLLPPSKTLALVEFFEPSEARKAFRSLAYKKYQHVPLYLEWAPVKVFTKPSAAPSPSQSGEQKGIKRTADGVVPDLLDGADDGTTEAANNTICVKNLNFSTTESSLEKLFHQCGSVRKVTVARRKDPKRGLLSMGFGFVEFSTAKQAEQAIEKLQSAVLDGHALNLKVSHKTVGGANNKRPSPADGDKGSRKSKIIVRNVAFEATTSEIRELFSAFGQLKRVRMPKKFDGSHRGFAFVEFLTEQEAQTAFSALASSHLYGRHLVLEWAEDADDMDTLRAKATKDLSAINAAGNGVAVRRVEGGGGGLTDALDRCSTTDNDRRKRRKREDDDMEDGADY